MIKVRVLILGKNGFLGSYFRTLSKAAGATLTSNVESADQKIVTHSDFENFFSKLSSIDVVINCLARANIDFCENNPEEAQWVNATLPGLISEYCAEKSISMVHFSTDAVFDGSSSLVSENMETNPLSVYGKTKLDGERNVILNYDKAIVIRTNFFGCSPRRDSFAEKAMEAAYANQQFSGYTDVFFTPTHARNVVEGTFQLINKNTSGLFHLTGEERLSKYEFARRLVAFTGNPPKLLSEKSTDNPLYAYRSKDLSLDNTKIQKFYTLKNTLDEDLRYMTEEFKLRGIYEARG